MQAPLTLLKMTLRPGEERGNSLNMSGRCAFGICKRGDFDILLMNGCHRACGSSIILGMPYMDIRLAEIREESEIIYCFLTLEEAIAIVNRTISSYNLMAIGRQPIISINESQLKDLTNSIEMYIRELNECKSDHTYHIHAQICHDIVEARARLIIGQVLKMYFTNIEMSTAPHSRQDIIFQHFMLDVYANFKKERKISYYAERSGLSLKYFSTLVRELSGASPSEWVEAVVVGEAKALLHEPDKSIKEIASSLNFPDAPTFSKYFLRVAGITPKDYRKNIMK